MNPLKIVYVAKHNSGGNDDEGAITWALRQLGHRVECIYETDMKGAYWTKGDLLLFHKWDGYTILDQMKGKIPRVCWYWDLVSMDDPLVAGRCENRRKWMAKTLPHVDAMFMSDGDWMDSVRGLYPECAFTHFFQGADERTLGKGIYSRSVPEIMFTGVRKGGATRMSFVDELSGKYKGRFMHLESNIHGETLRNLIASALISVAPDSPITPHYWSNRVYLTLGFGGFLLHPYIKALADQYQDGKEIIYYENRAQLHAHINYYMHRATHSVKDSIREAALLRTTSEHTYRHRCEKMLETLTAKGIL